MMSVNRIGRRGPGRRALSIGAASLVCAGALAMDHAAAKGGDPSLPAIGTPDALTIRASVRARTERIAGQFRPAPAADDLLWSLRTDIFAEYDAGPVRIGGELRDARGYFQRRTSSAKVSEINVLEPMQAYVAADLDGRFGIGSTASLMAGRFTMEVGSGRLIGMPDFANSLNSYTGARFDWRGAGKNRATLFWTMPSTRLPADPAGLRDNAFHLDRARGAIHFEGGSFTKARLIANVGGEAYVYHLHERDSPGQPTRDRDLLTYGIRLFRAPSVGTVDIDLEAARQTGKARATTAVADRTNVAVAATFAHLEIGRRIAGRWSPRISLHADYGSGDDADPRRYTRFDPLFGASRPDFGPGGLYGALNRSNLISGGWRVDVAPSKRLDGFVMARTLWLDTATDGFAQTNVRDARGRSGRYAGGQMEGRVRYWLRPGRLRLEGGGAYLAKGHFLRAAPNAPATGDTRYGYIDLTASF